MVRWWRSFPFDLCHTVIEFQSCACSYLIEENEAKEKEIFKYLYTYFSRPSNSSGYFFTGICSSTFKFNRKIFFLVKNGN